MGMKKRLFVGYCRKNWTLLWLIFFIFLFSSTLLIDLGFDFSDDQDDYETYDEGNLPTLTEKTDTLQQYHLDGTGDLTLNHQQGTSNTTKTHQVDSIDSELGSEVATTAVTLMDHDSQQQQRQNTLNEFVNDGVYSSEPNLLIASNRLPGEADEGHNTNSLLQAILTEGNFQTVMISEAWE